MFENINYLLSFCNLFSLHLPFCFSGLKLDLVQIFYVFTEGGKAINVLLCSKLQKCCLFQFNGPLHHLPPCYEIYKHSVFLFLFNRYNKEHINFYLIALSFYKGESKVCIMLVIVSPPPSFCRSDR